MTEAREFDLESLSDETFDDLYARLGAEVLGRAALPRSRQEAAALGKAWLAGKRSALAEVVCKSEAVRQAIRQSGPIQDRLLLAATIADLIAQQVIGIPPTVVAVLLVKEGVSGLCKTA